MQNRTLLDRQVELLRCLTGAELLFAANEVCCAAARKSAPDGISVAHLRLEAEISFQKRMTRIANVLKRTCFYLGGQLPQLRRDFAAAHPPGSYRSYDEASRFYQFLLSCWQSLPPTPPFIVDVARLEMASARAKLFRAAENLAAPAIALKSVQQRPLVRLAPGVEVLLMDYDLRPIFEQSSGWRTPVRRRHFLMIAPGPKIVEMAAAVASPLQQMETWTGLERARNELNAADVQVDASLHAWLKAEGFLEVIR
jgi:hypothetical protein